MFVSLFPSMLCCLPVLTGRADLFSPDVTDKLVHIVCGGKENHAQLFPLISYLSQNVGYPLYGGF